MLQALCHIQKTMVPDRPAAAGLCRSGSIFDNEGGQIQKGAQKCSFFRCQSSEKKN